MFFVGVLYTTNNNCSLFPCMDREQADHKARAIIGGRKFRKLSENHYIVYYEERGNNYYDRVFIGECDEDIEKTIDIQKQTRDLENLKYRKKYGYRRIRGERNGQILL